MHHKEDTKSRLTCSAACLRAALGGSEITRRSAYSLSRRYVWIVHRHPSSIPRTMLLFALSTSFVLRPGLTVQSYILLRSFLFMFIIPVKPSRSTPLSTNTTVQFTDICVSKQHQRTMCRQTSSLCRNCTASSKVLVPCWFSNWLEPPNCPDFAHKVLLFLCDRCREAEQEAFWRRCESSGGGWKQGKSAANWTTRNTGKGQRESKSEMRAKMEKDMRRHRRSQDSRKRAKKVGRVVMRGLGWLCPLSGER